MKNLNDSKLLAPLSSELSKAKFGDKRLSQRLGMISDLMSEKPGKSIPESMGDEAATEGAYRFLRNERVQAEKILEPHFRATCQRLKQVSKALVIHDTTQFKFSGEQWREGLGWLKGSRSVGVKTQGFMGHFSLAVSCSDNQPLGLTAFSSLVRTKKPGSRCATVFSKRVERESARWEKGVWATEKQVDNIAKIIHVMDREGDIYKLMGEMLQNKQRFVIRALHNRRVLVDGKGKREGGPRLFPIVDGAQAVCEREVPISRRPKSKLKNKNRKHPPRDSRTAALHFSAMPIDLRRVAGSSYVFADLSFKVNVVHVKEKGPPDGEQPVQWYLLTTEPIDTSEQILEVVDYYRARWTIEEYFMAIKTGCAYEKRQLESFSTLLKTLAIITPIAWRLLLLRYLSRTNPKTDAKTVLSSIQIKIIRHKYKRKLSSNLTVQEALYAIAGIGGHLKSNGPPGWRILWRGYREIMLLEEGWITRDVIND